MFKNLIFILYVFSFLVLTPFTSSANTVQRAKEVLSIYEDSLLKVELENINRNDVLDATNSIEISHYVYKKLTISNLSDKNIKIEGDIFNRTSRQALINMLKRSMADAAKKKAYIPNGELTLKYVSQSIIPDGIFAYELKPKEKKSLFFVMPISVELKGNSFWKGKIYEAEGSNPYIAINLVENNSKLITYNLNETSAKELLEAGKKKEKAILNIKDEFAKAKTNKNKQNQEPEEKPKSEINKEQLINDLRTLKELNDEVYKYTLIDGNLNKNKLSGIYIFNESNFDEVSNKAQRLENQVQLNETKLKSKYLELNENTAKATFKQQDFHILLFQNAKGLPSTRGVELLKLSSNKNTRFVQADKNFSLQSQSGNILFTAQFIQPGIYALNFNKFEKLPAGEYIIRPIGSKKVYDFKIEKD